MISLEEVSFGYNEEKTILKNIDFTIKKGSFIGIRGESGQGKSTLVNVIMGILNPTRGKVLIDGLDISISTNSYLKLISYIPQKVTIIDDTIKNNLLFGNQLTFTEVDSFSFKYKNYKLNDISLPSFHFGIILSSEKWNELYETINDMGLTLNSIVTFHQNNIGEFKSFFVEDPNFNMLEIKSPQGTYYNSKG